MLQLLRDNHNSNNISLNEDFHRDLNWFSVFLNSCNGITVYDLKPTPNVIYLDASLKDQGGCFNNLVYALPIPQGFMNYTIVHLEMVNVIVALKLWGPLWANAKVRIL